MTDRQTDGRTDVQPIAITLPYSGLERLQQLLDALTDAGDVLVQHVYRVIDADDAFQTLQRLSRHDETTKHILIDLPTRECEDLLNRQVGSVAGVS